MMPGDNADLPLRALGPSHPGAAVVIGSTTTLSHASKEPQAPGDHLEHGIMRIPVEIVLRVFGNLDLGSAFQLSETNKKFRRIFETHREFLILSILEIELSPFDDLLQYIVQIGEDLDIPLGPCLRRRIYHRGKLVSEGEMPTIGEEGHVLLPPVSLDQEHFRRLIATYHLVKAWEQFFPQYRFRRCLSDCRELRPHERERLRRAIYRWMSYAYYFHSDLKRPNRFIPEAKSKDIRCKKLRLLSNVELVELEDLWDTVVAMVSYHICPSTEQVMIENDGKLSLHDAEQLSFGSSQLIFTRRTFGWNDNTPMVLAINGWIVQTFLKLFPEDILHFATNRFVYTRDKVIREVRLAYPTILQDEQSFGHALKAVLQERCEETWATPAVWTRLRLCSSARQGGILDVLDPGSWSSDSKLREALDTDGERALSWQVEQEPELGIRTTMGRGRLEP